MLWADNARAEVLSLWLRLKPQDCLNLRTPFPPACPTYPELIYLEQ